MNKFPAVAHVKPLTLVTATTLNIKIPYSTVTNPLKGLIPVRLPASTSTSSFNQKVATTSMSRDSPLPILEEQAHVGAVAEVPLRAQRSRSIEYYFGSLNLLSKVEV